MVRLPKIRESSKFCSGCNFFSNFIFQGNIAYKKPSSQSSISTIDEIPLVASFANDGNRTGDWQGCSITKADIVPWWQVDLTRQAAVASVQIRSGATWGQDKINPFVVSVGDDRSSGGRNNALCVKDGTLASGELRKFDCPQVMMGRYVSIFLNRQEYLQVCEVEVYEGMCLNLMLFFNIPWIQEPHYF